MTEPVPPWRGGAGEAGFAGGLEGLLFGLLLFVVGTLLVATAWGAVDTKFAVDAAARQAVRTYVEAPDSAAAGPRPGPPPSTPWRDTAGRHQRRASGSWKGPSLAAAG